MPLANNPKEETVMKIQDLFESGNPNNPGRAILSFEVFPPKRDL